jgi:hypothetical protein
MAGSMFQSITHAGGAASHHVQGRTPAHPRAHRGVHGFGALGAVELGFESMAAHGAAAAHKFMNKPVVRKPVSVHPMARGVRRGTPPSHYISH